MLKLGKLSVIISRLLKVDNGYLVAIQGKCLILETNKLRKCLD